MVPKEQFTDEQRDDIKQAMKEAIREWLDDQFATFGRWSILSLAALGLAALAWFILAHSGWSPPGSVPTSIDK